MMSRTVSAMPQKLRPLVAPLLVLLLLTVIYGLLSLRIAALVGGQVITRSELATRMHIVQFTYDRQYGSDPAYDAKFAERYQRDVLDQLAEELILLPLAADLATAEEKSQYAESYLDWIKAGYFAGDAAKLDAALADLSLSEADLLTHFANNLLLTRLHEQQVQSVTLSDAEAESYYTAHKAEFDSPEMVKVSHIVVDSQAKAEQLLAELQAGGDFAALALANSLDKDTAKTGGSLRWFERGEMEAAFEQAAFALEPGGLSGVVQTSEGWHVIKMENKQAAASREFSQVKTLAVSKALAAKQDEVWNQYRRTLRGKQLILLLVR